MIPVLFQIQIDIVADLKALILVKYRYLKSKAFSKCQSILKIGTLLYEMGFV